MIVTDTWSATSIYVVPYPQHDRHRPVGCVRNELAIGLIFNLLGLTGVGLCKSVQLIADSHYARLKEANNRGNSLADESILWRELGRKRDSSNNETPR
jgi:hypothetical protein